MIYFSQRKEIEKQYREWASENNVPDTAFNVITFLSGARLLVETMEAAEFLKAETRMCDTYNDCTGCPVKVKAELFSEIDCSDFADHYTEQYVGIVKQWSEEHKE